MFLLPFYIPFTFVIITALCLLMILRCTFTAAEAYKSGKGSEGVLIGIIICCQWMTLVAWLSAMGVFNNEELVVPPIFIAFFASIILTMAIGFFRRNMFTSYLPGNSLTMIHILRLPVAIIMWWLYKFEKMPIDLTFLGRNYDAAIAISAPLLTFLIDRQIQGIKWVAGVWHLLGLIYIGWFSTVLLVSVSSSWQQVGLDQPNEAVISFPYIWLPTFVFPVFIFSHLAFLFNLFYRRPVVENLP